MNPASPYALTPLDSNTAAQLRTTGGQRYIADAFPGYPCRQCLRDAAIGEELLLVAHDPFSASSPYRSSSPIFIHATECSAPTDLAALPEQLTRRELSVRAFDCNAMMLDGAVIEGTELDTALRRFFANESVDAVHVHNAARGCWATTVRRAGRLDPSTIG